MPLKDRLWKFRKRHRIHFFLIEFSIFSRINSAAKIFPLPTSHTHITPRPPPLHSPLLPSSSPLCVLSNEISTRHSRMIRSLHTGLAWLQRVAGKDAASPAPHPSYHGNPITWLNTKFDCTHTHTLTHSHTHTLTHPPNSLRHTHTQTHSVDVMHAHAAATSKLKGLKKGDPIQGTETMSLL